MSTDRFGTRVQLSIDGTTYHIHRLDRIKTARRLPYSLKVLLENLLRNEDGRLVTATQIQSLADWQPHATPQRQIQLTPARVLMQDLTGVPCVVDPVAMRYPSIALGGSPPHTNALVPRATVLASQSIEPTSARPNPAPP